MTNQQHLFQTDIVDVTQSTVDVARIPIVDVSNII